MKYIFRFPGVKLYSIFFAVILFTVNVNGQQTGSVPIIKLTSPLTADSLNTTGRVLFRAEIVTGSPVRTYRIYNNKETILTGTAKDLKSKDSSTFSLETFININKGLNVLYLEVRNASATAYSEKRNITSQLEPFITWILPASTNSTSESTATAVRAQIKTSLPVQNIGININGTLLPQEKEAIKSLDGETYIFERTIQLQPGKNTVFITCGNARGVTNSNSRFISNTYDKTPEIKIISPSGADTLNNSGRATVRAEIVTRSPVKSYKLFRSDKLELSESGKNLKQKDSITYLIETFVPLNGGINSVYIEATNAVGTSGSEKRSIYCQSQPFVTWIMPLSENSNVESENITLRAEIKSGIALQKTIINVNGVSVTDEKASVTPPAKDTYTLEKNIRLKSGKNTIYISSVNSKGETRSAIRYVNCTEGATPVITLVSPLKKDTLNNSGLVTVSAEIVSKFDLEGYRIFNNRNAVISESAANLKKKDSITYLVESFVTLQSGLNTIFVEARNSAGMGTSVRRNITCQLEPIITWIFPSSVISNFDAGNMTIKAEIKTSFNLSGVSININGNTTSFDNQILKRLDNNTWVVEKSISLGAGANNFSLIATNARGSGKSPVRQVNYVPGVKPEINWILPSALNSVTEKREFQISATIRAKTQIKNTSLFVNGKELPDAGKSRISEKNAQESVYDNTITLNPGENNIYITATNNEGITKSDIRSIKYVIPAEPVVAANVAAVSAAETNIQKVAPSPPLLSWVSPSAEKNSITESNPRIRVKINSSVKVQSVLLYVNGAATETVNELRPSDTEREYLLERAINLNPGENNIYLVATTAGGTSKSDVRYITNPPTTPPVVSWATPQDSKPYISNSELVMIEACIQSATDLKSVQVLVNGVKQGGETFFQASQPGDCNYRFTNPVILKEGDNTVYIYAENFAGSRPSEARIIKYQKTLIAEKRIALIIGNANYGNSNTLKNPVNDANLMEATLKSLDFDVIKKTNAAKSEMEGAIREFSEKLPEYNVALFYYAGHGVQLSGKNYLVPTDAVLSKPTDCQWEAVDVARITQQFELVPENTNIIILDACRNNPFRSWVRGGPEGFKALGTVRGTFIAFATSEGSTAADGLGLNGVYTEELVKQMTIVQPIENVFKATRRQVMNKSNNQQIPTEWSYLTGDFFFKK